MCGPAGASAAGVAGGQRSGGGRGAGGARKADQGNGQAPIHCGVHVHACALHAHLPHSPLAAQVLVHASAVRCSVAAAAVSLCAQSFLVTGSMWRLVRRQQSDVVVLAGSLASPAVHGLGGEHVYPSYNSLLSETPNDTAFLPDEGVNGMLDEEAASRAAQGRN